MPATGAAAAGPTRPANPNPRPRNTLKTIAPPRSTNDMAPQPMAGPVGTKKRSPSDEVDEARKKRRVDGDEEKAARKGRAPVAKTRSEATAENLAIIAAVEAKKSCSVTAVDLWRADKARKELAAEAEQNGDDAALDIIETTRITKPANNIKSTHNTNPTRNAKPALSTKPIHNTKPANNVDSAHNSNTEPKAPTPKPVIEKAELTLKERMLKKMKEDRIAREAAKAEADNTKRENTPAPKGPAIREKRKAPWDDDSEEERPNSKKARSSSEASKTKEPSGSRPPSTPRVESYSQFASRRGQRRAVRQQASIIEAVESESRSPGHKQSTGSFDLKQGKSPSQDTNPSIRNATKPTNGRSEKGKTTISKQQVSDGDKKRDPVSSGGRVQSEQVKLQSLAKQSKAPRRRTDHQPGKTPAIESESGSDAEFDSDTEPEVEKKLSPKEQKEQLQQKKRKALADFREKRLALQAERAARTPTISPPSSSPSTKPSPGSPVAATNTVARSAPVRSRSSSAGSSGSTGSAGVSLSVIGRTLFKD